jgi:predicted DNA-binding transcriptional regulator YafY
MPPSPKNSHHRRRDATVRLERLLRLLQALRQRSGSRAEDLMPAAGCSRPTLYRELKFLIGLKWVGRDDQDRYVVLEPALVIAPITLTAEDALALALARSLLARPDVPLHHEIGAALDRAAAALLPAPIRDLFRQATAAVSTASPPWDAARSTPAAVALPTMIAGWLQRRTVRMDYDSASSGRRWRSVDPYEVTVDAGSWLVNGWCHERSTILSFALHSVHAAETTDRTFERNETAWSVFVQEQGVFLGLRGGPPVDVRVRLSAETARWSLRPHRWPAGIHATRELDGTVLLTGTARGTDGIVIELLRWRRHATVLGGPELRQAYRDEIAAMTAANSE